MTPVKFPSFAGSASTNCAPNKNSGRRRNDPHRLARIVLSAAELSESLECHSEPITKEGGGHVAEKLKFAHQFSNGVVGTIVVDPRRLRKDGAYAIIPNVRGEAPSDECESWMREVMLEIVTRTKKTVAIVGPSGVMWRFRPGQRPECLGLPKGFTTALSAFEFMRRNRNGGLAQ